MTTQTTPPTDVQRLQQFLQEEITKSSQLYDENTQLRETLGERDDYIQQLRAETSSCHSTINGYRLREERRKAFLRNTDLIPMEKLVALETLEEVESKRVNLTDSLTISVEQIAARVGATPGTVGKKFANLDKTGLLHYTIGETEYRDGNYYTPVTVAFTNLINDPGSIHKDPQDRQGGGREKKCLHCGSEDIDLYTVQYCRECRRAGWYGQVGLRKDANVLDAMRAAGRDDVRIHKSAWNAPENSAQSQPFHIFQDGIYENPVESMPDESILSSNSTIPEHDTMMDETPLGEDIPVSPPPLHVIGEPDAPAESEQSQPFHIFQDGIYEKPVESEEVTPDENTLPCKDIPSIARQDGDDAPMDEEIPVTPPQAESVLTRWLSQRLGNGRVIYATGSLQASDKYLSKPAHYTPDIAAYLRGESAHIYGSWLRDQGGRTSVLCFEIDQPEHNALASNYLLALTAKGAAPIYWQRARQRGHLELYFDAPVDPEAARAWCLSVCPALASIPECYPAQDKAKNALSWPLWQRIGSEVTPCSAYLLRDDTFIEADITRPDELAQLLTQAITPASLIAPQRSRPVGRADGGGLMEKKGQEGTAVASERDLARQVIADFNRAYSWEDIAVLCGGMQRGKFCAIWRGDQTPSVVPDHGGCSDLAIDYGRTGSWPRKFDKYEAWCLIKRIDKKVDLTERCSELRRQREVIDL